MVSAALGCALWAAAPAGAQEFGHPAVAEIARSPDGGIIAVLSKDGGVRLFDSAGKTLASLVGHTGPIHAIAFHPDGRRLATASDDRSVRLWNATTGAAESVLGVAGSPAYSVAFSPDGKRIAVGVYYGVSVFETATGKRLATTTGLDGAVRTVAMPSHEIVVGAAGTMRYWKLAEKDGVFTAAEIAAPDPHGAGAGSASAFEPPSRSVLSLVGEWFSGNRIPVVSVGLGLAFIILLAKFLSRRAQERHQWATLLGHDGPVMCVAISPDGTIIASAGEDKTVLLWDPVGRRVLHTLRGHTDSVSCMAFSRDGRLLATGGEDETVRLWNAGDGKEKAVLGDQSGPVLGLAFSPDGATLAIAAGGSAGLSGDVRLYDVLNGSVRRTLSGHLDWVNCVAFSPDGETLATGSRDKSVKLWNWRAGVEKAVLRGHTDWVWSLAFSPDGRMLATTGWDMSIKRWDVVSGGYRGSLHGHTGWIYSVGFNADGTLLATASEDKTVRLWSRATGEELAVLTGHEHWVTGAAFSPDGGYLASSGYDKTVRLWHVQVDTGKLFRPDSAAPAPKTSGLTDVLSGEFETVTPTPQEAAKSTAPAGSTAQGDADGERPSM